jgi:glucose/arabinose dehydrogenase
VHPVLSRLTLLGVILAGCAAALGGCVVAPPFTVTTVVSNLDHPWDVGWAGQTLVFTERRGLISAWVGGRKRVLSAPGDVVAVGESGMLGLAVDPQFSTNRYIYTCHSSNIGSVPDNRVVRWTVNSSFTGMSARRDIVTGMPLNTSIGNHSGCRLRFGPDGHLWVGTGDALSGAVPQSRTSLGGKVLRVTRTGAGAPGNLGAPFDSRIYNYGHRNVQGIAFRASDGLGVTTEHGPDRDDELNRLVPGNFGWDPVPGYNQSVPMTDLTKFPSATPAAKSSGSPTVAPSGATFVSGSQWGAWNGKLVVAMLKRRVLWVADVNSAGQVVDEGVALGDQGRLRSVAQGPNGNLYVTTDNGGGTDRILRLTPN